ncbi:hypothetical protein FOPE_02737 [Fonsecaea pedrosoi]|nr:hypothetical protein FOPE_02737 [Fonsecaea pedrosoi]
MSPSAGDTARGPHVPRSRASVACTACRRRKVKVNSVGDLCNVQLMQNGQPCRLCRNSGIECIVSYDDNRKINASKKHVRQLEERLESLESQIRSFQPPEERGISSHKNPGVSPGQSEITDPRHLHGALSTQVDRNVLGAMEIDSLDSHDLVDAVPDTMAVHPCDPSQTPETHKTSSINGLPESSSARDREDPSMCDLGLNYWHHDVFERPSTLIGQFPIPPGPGDEQLSTTINALDGRFPGHWLHTAPMEPYTNQGSPVNDTGEFRAKYLEKWWKFQDMSIYLVDPKLFMAGYERGVRSQHFSQFALDALIACALRLDKDESVRKLGRSYAERAKKQLIKELESPIMSTIHGFCLLSDYECTNGSENLGWIYVGIACRLIVDLGLHQDCTELVDSGIISKDDAIARQRMTYGTFVYEQVWSVFLGRPSSLKASNILIAWMSCGYSEYQEHLLNAWVDLSSLVRKMVNACNRIKLDHEKALRKCKQLDEAITRWETSLPPDLRWTEKDPTCWPPSLCVLYMQFCNIQILLHRTVSSCQHLYASSSGVAGRNSGEWPYSREQSQRIMHENAVNIAQTLEIRRLAFEDWGFATLMLDIIFTTASTLITSMASNDNHASGLRDHKWLICILEVCECLQVHYPVVKRMITVLNSLLESTGLDKFIWRGPAAKNGGGGSGQNETATPRAKDQRTLSHSSGRAAPFDPTRWCEPVISSSPDHTLVAGSDISMAPAPAGQQPSSTADVQHGPGMSDTVACNPWFQTDHGGEPCTFGFLEVVSPLNWGMTTTEAVLL